MTPLAIERVFGRGRLKMVTGRYVEVFREEAAPGERRRYTKRFLSLTEGDFRHWTEREWRLLARLVGHGVKHVPEIVQFDRGSNDKTALVQTYDAGVTIDHWATLLPVQRDGRVLRHVFRDCAHWWALAQSLLLALKEIHQLQLVHLDLKADNVCIPLAPTLFNPHAADQLLFPVFEHLALIDFAFSLVTGERLESPLPIGWQDEFPYQSPRLLDALAAGRRGDMQPTRELDWRCDMFSLAAMLERYLPAPERFGEGAHRDGWTDGRYVHAKALLQEIRASHDRDVSAHLPHDTLLDSTRTMLRHRDLQESLERGWTLAAQANGIEAMEPTVPMTRIEPPTHLLTVVEERVLPARPETLSGSGAIPPAAATPPAAPGPQIEPPASLVSPVQSDAAGPMEQAPPAPDGVPPTAAMASSAPAVQSDRVVPASPVFPPEAIGAPDAPAVPHGDVASPAGPRRRRLGRTFGYATAIVVAVALLAVIAYVARPDREAREQPIARAGQPTGGSAGGFATKPETPRGEAKAAPEAVQPEAAAPAVVPSDEQTPVVQEGQAPRDVARLPAAAPSNAAPASGAAEPARPKPDDSLQEARDVASDAPPMRGQQAEARVDRVLQVAARAEAASQDRAILDAIRSVGEIPAKRPGAEGAAGRSVARRLNASAREAFWVRRNAAEALALQLRAFDANPHDPEIAGNLAFYRLKVNPPQTEAARQGALHALAAATSQSGAGRVEDWGNLAVASALSGRRQDATSALFVMLAVSKDRNRACRSALNMVATFGPGLKPPVEAMFARIRSRGEAAGAPYCAWPPRWSAGKQSP